MDAPVGILAAMRGGNDRLWASHTRVVFVMAALVGATALPRGASRIDGWRWIDGLAMQCGAAAPQSDALAATVTALLDATRATIPTPPVWTGSLGLVFLLVLAALFATEGPRPSRVAGPRRFTVWLLLLATMMAVTCLLAAPGSSWLEFPAWGSSSAVTTQALLAAVGYVTWALVATASPDSADDARSILWRGAGAFAGCAALVIAAQELLVVVAGMQGSVNPAMFWAGAVAAGVLHLLASLLVAHAIRPTALVAWMRAPHRPLAVLGTAVLLGLVAAPLAVWMIFSGVVGPLDVPWWWEACWAVSASLISLWTVFALAEFGALRPLGTRETPDGEELELEDPFVDGLRSPAPDTTEPHGADVS